MILRYQDITVKVILQGSDSSAIGRPAHPFGLYLLGDTVFFTDWIHRALVAVNKFDGGEMRIIRANFTEQPMGIVAVDGVGYSDQCLCFLQQLSFST